MKSEILLELKNWPLSMVFFLLLLIIVRSVLKITLKIILGL